MIKRNRARGLDNLFSVFLFTVRQAQHKNEFGFVPGTLCDHHFWLLAQLDNGLLLCLAEAVRHRFSFLTKQRGVEPSSNQAGIVSDPPPTFPSCIVKEKCIINYISLES